MGTKQDRIIDLARRDPSATDAQIATRADASESYVSRVRRDHGLRAVGRPAPLPAAAATATLKPLPPTQDADEAVAAVRHLASVCDGAVALDEVGFSASTVGLGHQLAALDNWDDEERAAALGILWVHRHQLAGAGFDTSGWQPTGGRRRRVRSVAVMRCEGDKLLVSGFDGEKLLDGLGAHADAATYSRVHKAWELDTAAAAGAGGRALADMCLRRGLPLKLTGSVPADVAENISGYYDAERNDLSRWLARLEVTERLPGYREGRDTVAGWGIHYHIDADGIVWSFTLDQEAGEPLWSADMTEGVDQLGCSYSSSAVQATAFASACEHSPAALAEAMARHRNQLADGRERGGLFPNRGRATVSGGEATEAEVDAAYEHLCARMEEAARVGAAEAAALERRRAERAAAEAATTEQRRAERVAAEAAKRRQQREKAWARAASAKICDHTRTRDGRILVAVPDGDSDGLYCVEHDGQRQPVQAASRPFQARFGKLRGRTAVWAHPVPRPD